MHRPISTLSAAVAIVTVAACSAPSGGPGADAGRTTPTGPDTVSMASDTNETITFTGTIRRVELEGGFWAIESDDGRTYDPRSLPADFQHDGLRVRVRARPRHDMMGTHMRGPIVDVVEIARL